MRNNRTVVSLWTTTKTATKDFDVVNYVAYTARSMFRWAASLAHEQGEVGEAVIENTLKVV